VTPQATLLVTFATSCCEQAGQHVIGSSCWLYLLAVLTGPLRMKSIMDGHQHRSC